MSQNKVPLTRMDKQQLKEALRQVGYTEEQLLDAGGKSLKRPDLLEKLKAHKEGEKMVSVLANAEESDDDVGIEVDIEDDSGVIPEHDEEEDTQSDEFVGLATPSPNDPEWTQFVLGKFLDDEVDGQNPRVEGLRRVAGELVGEMIEEGCDLVSSPREDNGFRASVKAWGVFITAHGIQKRFEALADAHPENCYEDFATYLVAMADTRAKGRMFRNALCLRKVVSAEEVSKTVATSADVQKGGSIHTSQLTLIRIMADRSNLSLPDILDGLAIEYKMNENTGDVNLQSLNYEDALAVAKKIRELKEKKEKKDVE